MRSRSSLCLLFLLMTRTGAHASEADCMDAAQQARAAWINEKGAIVEYLRSSYPQECREERTYAEGLPTDEDKQAAIAWMERCDMLRMAERILAYEDLYQAWAVAEDLPSYQSAATLARAFAESNPELDLTDPMQALERAEAVCHAVAGCGD